MLLGKLDSIALAVPGSSAQRHRLRLTLISTVSSIPVSLLPETLHRVKDVISAENDTELRQELVDALYEELLRKVGDRGKAIAVRAWHDAKSTLENPAVA